MLILDQAKTIGAKILVSGGGRCNVTHDVVVVDDYMGSSKNIIRNILAAFNVKQTIEWFASMGVELKTEPGGKLFPVSDSARTILNALTNHFDQLGGQLQAGSRVLQIIVPDESQKHFTVRHSTGQVEAKAVIMAAGGRSLPRSGSDGSGWDIIKRLGHSVSETYAALVPLVLADDMFHQEVSGVTMEAQLVMRVNKKITFQRTGSMLWTHFGISGPLAMDASRHWLMAHGQGLDPAIECNLLGSDSFENAEKWLLELNDRNARQFIRTALASRLPERMADAILRFTGIDGSRNHSQLTREDRRKLLHSLVSFPMKITGHRGWNYAEVTAGGVPLSEISFRTMESRIIPGLYIVGEMLDCDGYIGGYNFQWAWATGFVAGNALARC